MLPKLGILAGKGLLPSRLIEACRKEGRDFYVIAFEGQTEEATVQDVPHSWVRLGAAGKAISILRTEGATDLVMAGGIKRPAMTALRPDGWGFKFLAKLGKAALGDDGLLSALIKELEKEGFHVIGADEILTDAIANELTHGSIRPDGDAWLDIIHGVRVARGLGALDVGQAAVVQQGLVLGVEAIEGTESLLARVAGLARPGPGGVLVKCKKPGQEGRADLPSVGPDTIDQIKNAGLRGIAVEIDGALVIDKSEVLQRADAAGIFVVSVDDQILEEKRIASEKS